MNCGIDIIEISRIEEAINKNGKYFLEKIYTENEIKYCEAHKKAKYQHYAARFAAKEAVAKMLGTGFNGKFDWTDIEVKNAENGCPEVMLYGGAIEVFRTNGYKEISISISHSKEYATSMVIGC